MTTDLIMRIDVKTMTISTVVDNISTVSYPRCGVTKKGSCRSFSTTVHVLRASILIARRMQLFLPSSTSTRSWNLSHPRPEPLQQSALSSWLVSPSKKKNPYKRFDFNHSTSVRGEHLLPLFEVKNYEPLFEVNNYYPLTPLQLETRFGDEITWI